MDFRLFPQMQGGSPQDQQAAEQQGWMQMGLGLLSASGQPGVSFNQGLAHGVGQGLQGYRQAVSDIMSGEKAKRDAAMQEMQLQQAQQQSALAQAEADARAAFAATLPPEQRALFGVAPDQYAQSRMPMSQAQQAEQTWREQQAAQQQANADRSYGLEEARLQIARAEAGRKGNLELKEVFDPSTGSVRYMTEEQALGQMAPPKSGMQIRTNPDGTMEFVQGPGAGSAMTTKTTGEVEGQMLDATAAMQRLNSIRQSWKPEYQELGTRLGNVWNAGKDKLGFLDDAGKQQLAGFTKARQDAVSNLNRTIKEVTGAAMSVAEAGRISQEVPNPGSGVLDGDSPTEFEAKLNNGITKTKLAFARLAYLRRNGLEAGANFGGVQIEDMPGIIDQRGDQIEQGLIQQGMAPAQAEQQAAQAVKQEFGL